MDEDGDHPEEDIEMENGDDVGEWVDPVRWSDLHKIHRRD